MFTNLAGNSEDERTISDTQTLVARQMLKKLWECELDSINAG
jgi:hypothetical protein